MAQWISDVPSSGLGFEVLVIEKLSVSDGSLPGTVAGPATLELRFSGCGILSFAITAEAGLVDASVEIGYSLII